VLALLALSLHARVLFFPVLEVSDAGAELVALPWRLAALLLHAGATVLVFALARRAGVTLLAAVLGALLFAAHPLRVEAVAWLSQRGALAGGFSFLLGASLVLGGGLRNALAARLALLAGLVLEPRLALAPLGLQLIERGLAGRRPSPLRTGLDLGLVLLASTWLSAELHSGTEPDSASFPARLARLPLALLALLRLACWPDALTIHAPSPVLAPWSLGAGWLVLALVGLGLVRLRRRSPRIALAGLLFLLLAAPHALVPRGAAWIAESAGYASLAGLELVLASLLAAAPGRLALGLGVGLVLACAARTTLRLSDWRSEPALQASALAVRAEPRAHDALGQWHRLHGRLGAAQREHERALELARARSDSDGAALAHLRLGEVELRRALIPGQERHLGRAAEHLENGLAAFPDWTAANVLLGEVYQRGGDDRRALARLEAACADSESSRAHVLLGLVRSRLSDPAGARAAFERATGLDARAAEAWSWLALVQLQAEEPHAAEASCARALALEPELPEARVTLARIQEARGERAEAERNLRRALAVHPDSVDGLFALGMLLSAAGRPDEALRYLDRLCDAPRYPPHVRASLESARLRLARGEVEVPRQRLRAVLEFNPEQAEARALLERLQDGGTDR
jgi:Tfp pilus assembly protein PilF